MLHDSPLGKDVQYKQEYSPEILFAIPRDTGRQAIGVSSPLPFGGVDMWTGYELSWLNARGKPQIAVAEFRFSVASRCLIESKSFKLYLNSFNGTRFSGAAAVEAALTRDLRQAADGHVVVRLISREQFGIQTAEMPGECIDDQDVDIDTYDVEPTFLSRGTELTNEVLYSDLLRSNCPVTGQPDWASVMIRYQGPRLNRQGLLKYIVSYRQHTGFHEQCVEQIFMDIKERCQPTNLTVYARYTRRGGLDINPYRSNFEKSPTNSRTFRQ